MARAQLVPKPGGSLADQYPAVSDEWDYEKNGSLSPNDIKPFSNQKVWWRCGNNHSWQAVVANRTKHHQGCPYCAGRRVIEGVNDLATLNPRLAEQWCYQKNGDLTPTLVMASSGFEVWWICDNGHTWKKRIADRNATGSGCPYCGASHVFQDGETERELSYGGRRAVTGENDLATEFPELLDEWDYEKNSEIDPTAIRSHSSINVWWICRKCGTSWNAPISRRTSQGSGCPECASGLRTSFPEQCIFYYLSRDLPSSVENRSQAPVLSGETVEVDIFVPEMHFGIEYDGLHWHASRKDSDEKKTQLLRESGLRLIRVIEGESNSAADNCIEYNSKRMRTVNLNWAIEQIYVMLGLQAQAPIDVRADGLEIRGQYIKRERESSIACTHPQIASEWHFEKNAPLRPEYFKAGSNANVWWHCGSCDRDWLSTIVNRTNGGNGCPDCANRRTAAKLSTPREGGSLADLHPELISEWDYEKNAPLSPYDVNPGTIRKAWWVCKHGHKWEAQINHRAEGVGCPYCSGRLAITGINDLTTVHPELLDEWDYERNSVLGYDPATLLPSSAAKVWWLCKKCNYSWQAVVHSRHRGSGCPRCAGNIHPRIICVETGKAYSTGREAAKDLGVNPSGISAVLHGRQKTAGGFHFIFESS